MAHVVGVPKREPCKQCGLPVFFAERLAVDGSFYHRKCLRCARCDSQLTPGNFYETEVDGVFCCETCPDEEKKLRLGNNNVVDIDDHPSLVADEQRQSFSEKLAMFQTNGTGLLQKSLSDEEKSKSLKRLSELYSKNCAHDANDVQQTIKETDVIQIDNEIFVNAVDDNAKHSSRESSDEEEDEKEDEKDDVPPSLPKTLPPSLDSTIVHNESNHPKIEVTKPKLPPIPSKANVLNKIYGKMNTEHLKTNVPKPLFQSQTSTEPSTVANADDNQSLSQKLLAKSPNEEHRLDTPDPPTITQMPQNNAEKMNTIETNLNTNNRLPLDALNSFTNVTKENAEFIDTTEHNANVHRFDDKSVTNNIDDKNDTEPNANGKNPIEFDLSMDVDHLKSKQNESNEEKEEQTETQPHSICNDVCNENNSPDTHNVMNDTNELDCVTELRASSSSISDNDRQKMVRSRLSQFEALVQLSEPTVHRSPRLNRNSVAATECVTKQNEQKNSINDNEMANISDATKAIEQLNVELDAQMSINQLSLNDDNEHTNDSNLSITTDSEHPLSTLDENNFDLKKPVPRQRATLNRYLDDDDDANLMSHPPTPSKRRTKTTTSEQLANTQQLTENNTNSLGSNEIAAPDSSLDNEINELKANKANYPNDLNPFGSDDEDDDIVEERKDSFQLNLRPKESLNPFDSSDDEIELMKPTPNKKLTKNYRISTNPFGSDSENENENETDTDSLSAKRTPVPTPRKPINGASFQTTPDISPRMSHTLHPKMRLRAGEDLRGSDASLASSMNYSRASSTLNRSSQMHGSMSSLMSSTPRHKKGRAPDIPTAKISMSASSSPSHSMRATPTTSRKKRLAPQPPKHPNLKGGTLPAHYITATPKLDDSLSSQHTISSESVVDLEQSLNFIASTESNYVSSSNEVSLSSTERNNFVSGDLSMEKFNQNESIPSKTVELNSVQRKLIPVDQSLLDDMTSKSISEMTADDQIVYRRKIIADVSSMNSDLPETSLTDRQCEKMKENKESQNKNRQSQSGSTTNMSVMSDESNQVFSPNKSSYGKWKRRKGPAPSLPIPPRKVIQMLPLQEIRHELEVIEVQQQGLEKQGVMLEKMIRERCEGTENENLPLNECKPNSKEVEDLILQLFELVNEKNELFRRQAELMYLRRQHRLEQEQADIEYEIRVLMAQPECNKTDSDKAREEALISRLVEVVQLRNEVIESLEMDRRREAEEDQSIKERLELHTAKRDEELCQQTPIKLSKKEKKKQKESKKLAKQKKMDADKDADESEISLSEKSKEKKKKKKFLFLHN